MPCVTLPLNTSHILNASVVEAVKIAALSHALLSQHVHVGWARCRRVDIRFPDLCKKTYRGVAPYTQDYGCIPADVRSAVIASGIFTISIPKVSSWAVLVLVQSHDKSKVLLSVVVS